MSPADRRDEKGGFEENVGHAAPEPSPAADDRSALPGAGSEGQVVDWDHALKRVGGSDDILMDIVQIFHEDECPALAQQIRDALARGDATVVNRAAHTMKSALDLLGATAAYEAAAQLESLGQQSNLEKAGAAWKALETELARVQQSLHDFRADRAS